MNFQGWVGLKRSAPLNGLQHASNSEEKSETEPDEGGLCCVLVNDLGQRQDDEDHGSAYHAAMEDRHQAEASAQDCDPEEEDAYQGHERDEHVFHIASHPVDVRRARPTFVGMNGPSADSCHASSVARWRLAP